MTAAGKITTANLVPGTRILIVRESDATAALMEREPEMRPATKQAGATIARVIEVRAGQRRRYESVVPREVVTTAGVVRAAGHQTFILAPETPAAVKKAHVEALAIHADIIAEEERAAESAAAAKVEDEAAIEYRERIEAAEAGVEMYDAETIEHVEAAISTARVGTIDHIAKAIGDAWSGKRITTKTFDRLNRLHANRFAALKEPKAGDMIRRIGDGPGAKCFRVREVSPARIVWHGIGLDCSAGVLDRPEWRFHFVRVASEDFRARAARCSNEWHRTGPIREIMLCPDCPL